LFLLFYPAIKHKLTAPTSGQEPTLPKPPAPKVVEGNFSKNKKQLMISGTLRAGLGSSVSDKDSGET
jgi:hypothetical protein